MAHLHRCHPKELFLINYSLTCTHSDGPGYRTQPSNGMSTSQPPLSRLSQALKPPQLFSSGSCTLRILKRPRQGSPSQGVGTLPQPTHNATTTRPPHLTLTLILQTHNTLFYINCLKFPHPHMNACISMTVQCSMISRQPSKAPPSTHDQHQTANPKVHT
jgi:hypothetical protein